MSTGGIDAQSSSMPLDFPSLIWQMKIAGDLIDAMKWLVKCKLRHLKLTYFYDTERLPLVLDHTADLQRLTLGQKWEPEFSFLISNEGLPFNSSPQLTSSIVIDNELSLDRIHTLLCSTSSLLWLKMENSRYKATHGSQWEHLIATK
jgi:hypothetical protein